MLEFERFELKNGLRVLFHQDKETPIAAVNLIYDVGAKDESPERTGFAHLFEHLMFGGSENVKKFDRELEQAGGKNNAFTSNDYTNYYDTLPKSNIETALWLESDRMKALAFTDKVLNVQKGVVIEEFKQSYLNQPYGDIWALMRSLAYKVHPYQWPTIGKEISHIEEASMQEVKDFFYRFYAPNNAILTIAGDFELSHVKELCQKWFGSIPRRDVPVRNLPVEPVQTKARRLTVERDVPYDAFFKAYHICKRSDPEFYATDIISDIFSGGESSVLTQVLVREKKLFTNLHAFLNGSLDNGLFVFAGHLVEGVGFKEAEEALMIEVERLKTELVSKRELQKVKNNVEANLAFSIDGILNKALILSNYELWTKAEVFNHEAENYNAVSREDILSRAQHIFRDENSSTLYYKSKRKG
ncbi:MAG: pitrilysin family protein [Bacteroidota bacterium]|nr:pitrilysin family protein [Bacteroidota bacterium]